jgi:hypothetical protein
VSRERPVDYDAVKNDFDRGRLDVSALAARLSDEWAAAYRSGTGESELVEVDQGALTYLFDIAGARVVGVYGHSAPTNAARPAARMRGFPLPATSGEPLVRGHLVAHAVGGGTDINLVPQNAALNASGAWRRLERLTQSHPGSFVAVEVGYDDDSQTPSRFTYIVAAVGALTIEHFLNA